MRVDSTVTVFIFIVLSIAFMAGIIWLAISVYDIGENYPVYSTYRSDPVGLRIYFEALQRLGFPHVTRNMEDLTGIGDGHGNTLIIAGAVSGPDPIAHVEKLEHFVNSGGRLVIVFEPQFYFDYDESPSGPGEDTEGDDVSLPDNQPDPAPPEPDTKPEEDTDWVDIQDRWGFRFKAIPMAESDDSLVAVRNNDDAGLPESMGWYSHSGFEAMDTAWEAVYLVLDQPVVLQRSLGKGTVVLCSDTFQLSNEALASQPASAFLAWLPGEADRIIFDESHLGIRSNPGIMMLIHRFRLTGLIILALVFAIFWLWSCKVHLIPRRHTVRGIGATSGTVIDATGGLGNLLMRHIPQKDLLMHCVDAWSKEASGEKSKKTADMMRLMINDETEKAGGKPDVSVLYRRLSDLHNERKLERGH